MHVARELFGSVAALSASVVIIYTGWTPIDAILSVLVTVIILKSAWAVVKESGHILLEGAPHGFDRRDVAETLLQRVDGLTAVHHIHAWSVTEERPMVTLEIEVDGGERAQIAKAEVKKSCAKSFMSTIRLSKFFEGARRRLCFPQLWARWGVRAPKMGH